jgi:hypothetical protein
MAIRIYYKLKLSTPEYVWLYCYYRGQQIFTAGILLLTLGKQVTADGYQTVDGKQN